MTQQRIASIFQERLKEKEKIYKSYLRLVIKEIPYLYFKFLFQVNVIKFSILGKID